MEARKTTRDEGSHQWVKSWIYREWIVHDLKAQCDKAMYSHESVMEGDIITVTQSFNLVTHVLEEQAIFLKVNLETTFQ